MSGQTSVIDTEDVLVRFLVVPGMVSTPTRVVTNKHKYKLLAMKATAELPSLKNAIEMVYIHTNSINHQHDTINNAHEYVGKIYTISMGLHINNYL